jgi:hypothetical protein
MKRDPFQCISVSFFVNVHRYASYSKTSPHQILQKVRGWVVRFNYGLAENQDLKILLFGMRVKGNICHIINYRKKRVKKDRAISDPALLFDN